MKRLLITSLAFLIAVVAFASQSVRNLDIKVVLDKQGAAHITELWDVSSDEGTEWYLVRSNLGDIRILNLSVTDETGAVYVNEGEWDVNRSLSAKAGKCGIVTKSNGCEICWGLGSHGRHTFTVSYTMTNAVKSLNDYDMLHMQFVSPGISASMRNVKVTVSAKEDEFNATNTRIWGFGYDGTMDFQGDGTVAATASSFSSRSSVIILARFDKGMFNSESVQDRDFQAVLDRALEGADFSSDDDGDAWIGFLFMFVCFFASIFAVRHATKVHRENIIGKYKIKDIDWCREVPFSGNILESYWVLSKLYQLKQENTFASAMILKMIKDGNLSTRKDADDKIEIFFNDSSDMSKLSAPEKQLYDMMKEASGADVILQNKEFSRWSRKNTKRVNAWITLSDEESWADLARDKYAVSTSKLNEAGQAEARKVIGFKKYLSDFTLSKERTTAEVGLWQDYLIFASLFGIADKVAKELKDINPKMFEEAVGMDPYTYVNVMRMSNSLANSITNAKIAAQQAEARARGGYGGHSSFGGGGGFSGGGFGGGAR